MEVKPNSMDDKATKIFLNADSEMDGVCKELKAFLNYVATEEVSVDWQILTHSEEIRHISNIKYKDSIHLACAEATNADVLLTTDKTAIGLRLIQRL